MARLDQAGWRCLKIFIVVVLLCTVGAFALTVYTVKSSRIAVSHYYSDVNTQYGEVVSGKDVTNMATLQRVPLVRWPIISRFTKQYQKVDNLQSAYQQLVQNVQHYNKARQGYNYLASQLSQHVSNDDILRGDFVNQLNNLASELKRLPVESSDAQSKLADLSNRTMSSTKFKDIADVADKTLDKVRRSIKASRDIIERERTAFQSQFEAIR